MPWSRTPTLDDVKNRINQVDKDRLESDILSGRAEPKIENMRIGEAREFNLAVLHIDINGYKNLVSDLTNKEKLRFLNTFLTELTYIIHDYDGMTEKYVGDRVTALFGIGKDGKTAAQSCIDCALTMLTEIKYVMNPFLESIKLPKFSCSVGIDYGEVWIARIGMQGDNQLSLVGNVVNIASQLQDMANSNQILLGGNMFNELINDKQKRCSELIRPNDWTWVWSLTKAPYKIYSYTGFWVGYPL